MGITGGESYLWDGRRGRRRGDHKNIKIHLLFLSLSLQMSLLGPVPFGFSSVLHDFLQVVANHKTIKTQQGFTHNFWTQ